jgi:hypothetical protein
VIGPHRPETSSIGSLANSIPAIHCHGQSRASISKVSRAFAMARRPSELHPCLPSFIPTAATPSRISDAPLDYRHSLRQPAGAPQGNNGSRRVLQDAGGSRVAMRPAWCPHSLTSQLMALTELADVLSLLDSGVLRGASGAVRIVGAVSVHAGVGSSSDTHAITSRPCACSHSIAFA